MKLRLAADDVVIALFKHIELNDNVFTVDRETLHTAFYKLKQINPKPMEKFLFRDREIFPESIELDQAIINLEHCGLIVRVGTEYRIDKNKIDIVYKNFSASLLKENEISINDIKLLAQALTEELSNKENNKSFRNNYD